MIKMVKPCKDSLFQIINSIQKLSNDSYRQMSKDIFGYYMHSRKILSFCYIFMCLACYGQGQITRPNPKQAVRQKSVVKVSDADDYINGHGYVDLGLPSGVRWAICNVGSEKPSELGNQYAWGELETKDKFSKENSIWQDKEINEYGGNPEYDVASKLWGVAWRQPTLKEIQELVDLCKWKWTKLNGKRGFVVTGPNNKSIFLPARMSTYEFLYGEYFCNYWSSTPGDPLNFKSHAMMITSADNSYWVATSHKYNGCEVRPVLRLNE